MDDEKDTAMGQVIRIDEARIRDHLGEMVRGTVEDALNAMLDAEADRLCGAGRYERCEGRQDTRADSYERGDAAPGDAAFVMACEERIFAIKGDGADQVFDPVAVDFHAAVGQEGLQPFPVVMDVGQLFAQPGFGGDLAALRLKPVAEGRHQRRGAGLAGREALVGRDAADIDFHGMELGNAAQALSGNFGAIAVKDLFQFSPGMRPAVCHPNPIRETRRQFSRPCQTRRNTHLVARLCESVA